MKGSQFRRGIYLTALGICLTLAAAGEAQAAMEAYGPGLDGGGYVAEIVAGNPVIYISMDSGEVLREAMEGEYYQIVGCEGNDWLEVLVGEEEGYIACGDGISVVELAELEASWGEAFEEVTERQIEDQRRRDVVEYALQFLGCAYRTAGNDPHTGVDCSGFVRYVLKNSAEVEMMRYSQAQAEQGVEVSAEEMQPGDLIFYGKGGSINHVGMYAGNGQVVHASTHKTGVKLSAWNYRAPMKIMDVLSE